LPRILYFLSPSTPVFPGDEITLKSYLDKSFVRSLYLGEQIAEMANPKKRPSSGDDHATDQDIPRKKHVKVETDEDLPCQKYATGEEDEETDKEDSLFDDDTSQSPLTDTHAQEVAFDAQLRQDIDTVLSLAPRIVALRQNLTALMESEVLDLKNFSSYLDPLLWQDLEMPTELLLEVCGLSAANVEEAMHEIDAEFEALTIILSDCEAALGQLSMVGVVEEWPAEAGGGTRGSLAASQNDVTRLRRASQMFVLFFTVIGSLSRVTRVMEFSEYAIAEVLGYATLDSDSFDSGEDGGDEAEADSGEEDDDLSWTT
jgi:hypothetical protein